MAGFECAGACGSLERATQLKLTIKHTKKAFQLRGRVNKKEAPKL
jgi:hypothetical protein